MEVKMKEVVVYIRKYLLLSIKSSYKFTCRHPFVASFAFSLFLLYSCFPSLFAFLVSSSPVLSCTALLLGFLLSYGEPNIPEIEEDDKINQEVSSLKVENSVDDLFVKKEREIDFSGVSSSVEEHNQIVENLEVLMKEQSESYMRTSEVADSVSEGIEGLMVKINKPVLDDWIDSSLGSPWQPINLRDATSDSESDRAESSSPDASMADILPMLDELYPLLDSESPRNAPKSADNSDLELSQHHESDEDSVEKEDEYKTEGKDESNKVVTWTEDDQKNVMDLGSSDLERNRRLENLIARRRARKNQIIIFEKDLIDLHSNDTKMDELFQFHPQIPHIFAPRRNPFDPSHGLDESKGLPPIPGSAPSVLLSRQNPFDFPCDSDDGNKGLAGESSRQPEFGLPSQRGFFFRRHESFASHSAFPSYLMHEKLGSSRLSPYFDAEKMDSEGNDYVDFHSQLSGKSETKSSSIPTSDNTVSSAIDPEDQKVPTEQETQEGIALSVPVHHTKPTEQYSQYYEEDLVDSQPELGEDSHSVDPNASAVSEETYQGIDASGIVKKTIEEIQFGQNHEVVEEKHNDLILFSSSEKIEKCFDINLHEVLETQEQSTSVSKLSSEFMQSSDASSSHLICESEGVDNNQAAVPIYDSSPSGSGNFLANISVPDDNLLSSGRGDLSVTSKVIEFNVVHESKLQDSRSSSGETVTFPTYMNLLDENISASMGVVSETGEQDFNENSSPGIDEDFGDLDTSLEIDHSFNLSSAEVDNEPSLAFSVGFPPSEVEEKHQSMEEFEMQTSFGTYLEESRVSNYELGPILEENSEDFKVEEEHISLVQTTTTFASTGFQTLEAPDVGLSSVGQQVVSLYNQSKEEARDEDNEGKPSKTYNLVSANDEMFTGLVVGELVDSMEFSNQSKMKSEHEITSNDDISHSQGSIIKEFQINEDVILRNLNDFHSEHGDIDDDDVIEMQVIDEHLLSELDAVGDFQVEELKSQSDSQFVCSEEDSELGFAHVVEMSPNKSISANLIDPDEMDLDLNQEEPTYSGYWSLAMAPVEDLTVYNPNLKVLEACSPEEHDFIFKQDHHGELVEPLLSETITEKSVAEKPYIGWSRFDMVDQEIEAIPHEAVLLTLSGKNAEDISSALIEDGRDFDISATPHEMHKYDPVESVIPSTSGLISYSSAVAQAEASSGELDISSRDFEIEETDSELLVLEAKSIEDIHSAFKNVTELVVNKSFSPLINPEPMITHPVDTLVEALSPEVEKTSGLLVEAKSAFKLTTEEGRATSIFCFSDPETMTNRLDFEVMEPSSPDAENSSKLFVLEARSDEDIQLAFKQATEEASAMPTSPLLDSESSKTNQDHEVVEAMHLETRDDTELLVPERKSSEDIDSDFEQADVDLGKPTSLFSALSGNQIDSEAVDVKSLETQNDPELFVLDAKYVDDIDSSFKPSSEGGLLRSTSLEFDPDLDAVKDKSLQASTNSDLLVLEAESVEETSSTTMLTEGVFDKSSPLVDPETAGTSEVASMISLGLENDSDLLSLEEKSFQYLNSACKQDSEGDLVRPNLPELRNFQPDHDAVEESSLNAIYKPEPFSLESKSFEETHWAFKEAAADFCGQSTTALVDPGCNPGVEILDVKSPDSGNISDFLVLEANSLESLNLAFREAIVLEEKSTGNIQSTFSDAHAFSHEGSSSLPVDPEPMETHPGREAEENMSFEAENHSEMLVVEARSLEDINSAFNQATDVVTSPLLVDSGSLDIESPLRSLVLEANSVELTDSALKKVHQEVSNKSTFFTDPPPLQTNSDDDFIEESSLGKNDSELLVLEEKYVEDIDSSHSTFTQVTEGYHDRPVTLQDDSKQTETHTELEHKDSMLPIPEPKSLNDINVVAKQVIEEDNNKGINQEVEGTAVETSEPRQDAEVEYAKETVVAYDVAAAGENSSSEDQINRRTDGEEAGSEDDPSSSAPPSTKIKKKKKKFEESDSSSSSSSSDSE